MPKNYSSPKEALLDHKRIKEITRGRISRDNNAWIDEQITNGAFTISGMTVAKPVVSTGAVPAKPTVKRTVASSAKVIADIPESPFRDEDMYDVADETGKRLAGIGMRNVDNRCGNSFTYCMCREPRIYYGDREVSVTFIPKARKK